LKLTIVPDSKKKERGDDGREKRRRGWLGVLERIQNPKLELGGIDVVKTWCVQSGNWLAPQLGVVETHRARCDLTPNMHIPRHIRYWNIWLHSRHPSLRRLLTFWQLTALQGSH
jgi:hypothetical protein